MTPYELNLHITSHNERATAEYNEKITLAYMTAYWGRVKRMPDLKKLLGEQPEKKKRKQSPEEMFAIVKQMHTTFSGKEGQGK